MEQLTKHKDEKIFCTYKTNITWLGACGVTVRHKIKNKLCRFFVVPGGGLAILEMPKCDCKQYSPEDTHGRLMSKAQNTRPCTNKNSNAILMVSNTTKYKIDYFNAWP